MLKRLLRILNPLDSRGGYIVPHALVILAALIMAFSAGWAGKTAYDAHFYRTHFTAPLVAPKKHVRLPYIPQAGVGTSGSIHLRYWQVGQNDQSWLGACQDWAYTKQLSYAYNWNKPHHAVFFSPRFNYDEATQGTDAGSAIQWYPPISNALGAPLDATFPYGPNPYGLPAYDDEWPVPAAVLRQTVPLHVTEQDLFTYQGAGPGGISLIEQAIASHHAVNIDIPVYPEYDNAKATGGYVDLPKPGEQSRGGHANTLIAYKTDANGRVWFLASNQWGAQWAGIDEYGRPDSNGDYAWLSADFIAQYGWGAAVIHVYS